MNEHTGGPYMGGPIPENTTRWELTITAEADTRPGTPEEQELARWRADWVDRLGIECLSPEPPADDMKCAECFTWQEIQRTPGEVPGVYAWYQTCSPVCAHECHEFDPVAR